MKRMLFFVSVFCLSLFPSVSSGSAALDRVEIVPSFPLSTESIEVTVSGVWPTGCPPDELWIYAWDDTLTIDAGWQVPPENCIYVMTDWELTGMHWPLEAGIYTVLARGGFLEYEDFGRLVVGGPAVYDCVIEPGSLLLQTGGIAGVEEMYAVAGSFRFVHDPRNGRAWLTRVEITSEPGSWLPAADLDELLNLSRLESAAVTADGAVLTGQASDGAEMTLEVIISGQTVSLGGGTSPPCCDFFIFGLYADSTIVDEAVCTGFSAMDFNRDCQVNLIDLTLLLGEWMQCGLVPADVCD